MRKPDIKFKDKNNKIEQQYINQEEPEEKEEEIIYEERPQEDLEDYYIENEQTN